MAGALSYLIAELDWGIAMKIIVEFTLDEFEDFQKFIQEKIKKQNKTRVSECEALDARTINCLLASNIEYIEDALSLTDIELLKVTNLGRRSLAMIRSIKI
jgi:DNA-directed RNA polymerase alpha subunit